jgi:hypothetical protein
MKRTVLILNMFLCLNALLAQTSDNAFKKPLTTVLQELQSRFGIVIKYPEALVKDRMVTFAEWRFRNYDLDKTLNNILASQDITYTKTGDKAYKLKSFEYHLKTPEEGKEQLDYLSTLYSDVNSWEKRKDSLKQEMMAALRLSPLPPKPSSLPIICNKRKMDGYTIENIAFELLPGLYICGSLYKPSKIKGKIPVVLCPDGHWDKHRYRADCQYRCAMLAKMGAMAVSYDLFAWGESLLQFKTEDHRRALAITIQALSSIRILDYLLAQKEADTSRVAITGGSGGGSQTMLMTALDDRIKLSVPVVMLSSYHSGGCPCESGMGVHVCGSGTNNAEIAAMAAPRPQLAISDGKDWTQQVPTVEFPYLQKMYAFYGADSLVKNVHLPTEGHDYGTSKRTAMYEFVAKHFKLNINAFKKSDGSIDESGVTIEDTPAMLVFGKNGEQLPANAIKGFEQFEKEFNEIQK